MNKKYNVYTSDDRRGFINQNTILEYVSQEEIFELVFGYQPKEYVYVTSPFRTDRNAGCWFERTNSHTGKLRFVDFANDFNKPMDCFDAVQQFYKLPNFYLTLEFVYDRLISGRSKAKGVFIIPTQEERKTTSILFDSRPFITSKDGVYWKRYDITKQNLIDDKVFPIKKYYILNGKLGDYSNSCYDIAYAYTNFADQRKKLYFPYRDKKKRFITTCIKNDIGGLEYLPPFGKEVIITKSYKDWRVLYNNGKNVIYLQNEGMIPEETLLLSKIKGFNKVIVWFDNDAQGIISSNKVTSLINSTFPSKASPLWLPEHLNEVGISDPSDLYYHKGKQQLHEFFKTF